MNGAARILVISNDDLASEYLREQLIIEGQYSVSFESSPQRGLTLIRQENLDLVILESETVEGDISEYISALKKVDLDAVIIAFVHEISQQRMNELQGLGIYDLISMPLSSQKFSFMINKGIELHAVLMANRRLAQGLKEQNSSLEKQNVLLARRIEESTKNLARLYEDLRSTYMRTIRVLAQAIDARDHYTHSHSQNVAIIAMVIVREMGFSAKETEIIREACELHDLGKIGIEDSILSKPASLTPEEWVLVRKHPNTGAKILEPLTFLNDVIELIRQHHEHYDGTGYPEGRKGEDILLGARIIHLADAYEAMCTPRAYRKMPFTKKEAIAEIKKHAGTQFDPKVVEVFLKIADQLSL